MSLFEDDKTREVVRKVRDIENKKYQDKKGEQERDRIEEKIHSTIETYGFDRNSAELYVKHEEVVSTFWSIVYIFIVIFLFSMCYYELACGPGAVLKLLGLEM